MALKKVGKCLSNDPWYISRTRQRRKEFRQEFTFMCMMCKQLMDFKKKTV